MRNTGGKVGEGAREIEAVNKETENHTEQNSGVIHTK